MAIKAKYGYYPANFDLEGFCQNYNLPANKVVSILHLFIVKPVGQEDDRWITLNATILKKRVGDIYKAILEALFDFEVIDIDHNYEVGDHSKAYFLLDKYQYSEGFKKYSIEKGLLNKALEAKNRQKANLSYLEDIKLPKIQRTVDLPDIIFNGKYRTLINWFKDGKLTIDYDKDYNLKSDINQRFYSGITNLPKDLRKCLLYDGEELAGVDVSNTQPLLLSELCNPIYLKQLKKSNSIEVKEKLFDDFLTHLNTYPEDLKQYKKLVESGKLYESFVGIAPDFTRDIVKENMVIIINDKGHNNTREKKILRDALKQKFPTIAMLLTLLKSVNHKYTSYTLMTLEAQNFVIHFPEIFSYKEAHKNIPIFTIHDCFMTTTTHIDYLEKEIKTFFQNKLMINLPMKRE